MPADDHPSSRPTRGTGDESTMESGQQFFSGDQIGPYKILQEIGEGGFGIVFEAQQSEPVHRRVALKLIKPGMDTRAVIARFEAERQALAVMDHPGVARVFDGGTTDNGRPYFVMELVHGESITEFCDQHRLNIRERCALFIKVCEAVQHAHSKGVVHRDLKPSNILVMYLDSVPVPKIIDFGVAKALNRRLSEETFFTTRGQLIGTPEYMSPEQAEMSGIDIDTRTDVYSLGVILYELLSGQLPFDPKSLRQAAIAEIQRIIREVDPPKPSTRLSTVLSSKENSDRAQRIVKARRADPTSITRILRRDLDWVVMRCLEKDRERRYSTPLALAQELGRYLNDEPVLAGPPKLSYRLWKFTRRNRRAVMGAALIALAITIAAGVSTSMWVRESIARQRAERAELESNQMLAHLTELVLGASLEQELSGTELEFETQMQRSTYSSSPLEEARARLSRAVDLNRSGEATRTLHHAQLAIELFDKSGNLETEECINAMRIASFAFRRAELYGQAETFAREAIALAEGALADRPERIVALRALLASILRESGRLDEAIGLCRDILEQQRALQGEESKAFSRASSSLALALQDAGQLERATTMFEQLHASALETWGADDLDTLALANNLGRAYKYSERTSEAISVLQATLERVHAVRGDEDRTTRVVKRNLAYALQDASRHEEAEQLLSEAIATQFRLSRLDTFDVLEMLVARAESLMELDQRRAASSILIVGESLSDTLGSRTELAPSQLASLHKNLASIDAMRGSLERND